MGLKVVAKQDEVGGIPIPEMRAFYDAIGDGPVPMVLESLVHWQGRGTRALAEIGPFTLLGERKERLSRKYLLQFDDWAEMPGCEDAGPEAMEVVLAALGACIVNMTSWHAARMGIELEELSVKVQVSVDVSGFFHNYSQDDKFGPLQYEVSLKAKNSTREELETLAKIGRNCPVCRMLSKPMELAGSVLIN